MRLKLTTVSVIALVLLGCTVWKEPSSVVHKMDIRQGNVLSDDAIAQLKPGLTKEQVEFLLGPPTITDTFHANRWDYVCSLEKEGKQYEFKHITLYFKGDRLEKIVPLRKW